MPGWLPKNGTMHNAVARMVEGYEEGLNIARSTVYAMIGDLIGTLEKHSDFDINLTKIRFMGLRERGLVVTADLVLPDGRRIFAFDRDDVEEVSSCSVREFLEYVHEEKVPAVLNG